MKMDSGSGKKQWKILLGLFGLGALLLVLVLCALALLPADVAGELLPFSDWKPMPALPERAVALVDANNTYVYVRGASGNIFRCQLSLLPKDCWKQTHAPVVGQDGWFKSTHIKMSSKAPRNAVSTLAIESYTGDYIKVKRYFALMPDGSVSLWSETIDAFSFLPMTIIGVACVILFLLVLGVYFLIIIVMWVVRRI